MMYQNKLVVAVKVGGKILREFKEIVKIPFGTEYSLLIKNLNSVRAQVRVAIDGNDMTDGTALVIMPNSEVELERSIRAGNFNSGNRFKFIERTEGIEQHRGVKAEDGLIRISYFFERLPVAMVNTYPSWSKLGDHISKGAKSHDYYGGTDATSEYQKAMQTWSQINLSGNVDSSSISGSLGMTNSASTPRSAMRSHSVSSDVAYASAASLSDVGITVPGSVSHQKFQSAGWFALESQEHVMVLKLVGQIENQPVQQPVVVKTKQRCVSCGVQNRAIAKFCSACGTSLDIV